MTIADRHEIAGHFLGTLDPREPRVRVVTFGPGEEDWAVLDEHGQVAYVGPAVLAARYAALIRT